VDALEIRPGIIIPASDLIASFSRSGGPGGQNVNKVETRATLRYLLESSAALPEISRIVASAFASWC
jgi:ribosome-associated protein